MRFVNTFDPSLKSSGTIPVGMNDSGQKVLMYNESPITIQLNFTNGSTTYLHAWEANYWTLDDPAYEIEWISIRNLSGSGQAPASFIDVFVYGVDEKVEGTYPVQLSRLTNLGNQTVGSAVTAIVNDGNASGTSVVESTMLGSSGSNVSLDNQANLVLRQYVSATLTTLLQTIAGAANGSSNVKLSDSLHQCEVLGNLLVDLALTVSGNATITGNASVTGNILCMAPAANSSQYQAVNSSGVVKDILYINSANNLCLQSPIVGKVFVRDSSGNNLFSVDSSGNVRAKGTITASVTP